MSGESRVDLLNWVNVTLNLNYTKVEQLGTGAAYCQLIDSIYLDVPMGKVKFDTTKEYEYLNNFKILQASFLKHKINKNIPVDRLVKCKFQDNLEFFQWIRKYWKDNKDESEYDPNSRRKYLPPPAATPGRSSRTSSLHNNTASSTTSSSSTARRTISSSSSTSLNGNGSSINSSNGLSTRSRISSQSSRPTSRVSSISNTVNKELEQELNQTKTLLGQTEQEMLEYKEALEALETERNFYFNKLREIEILTESTKDVLKDEKEEHPTLTDVLLKIQEILYNTEEGFQVPDDTEVPEINMEEETF